MFDLTSEATGWPRTMKSDTIGFPLLRAARSFFPRSSRTIRGRTTAWIIDSLNKLLISPRQNHIMPLIPQMILHDSVRLRCCWYPIVADSYAFMILYLFLQYTLSLPTGYLAGITGRLIFPWDAFIFFCYASFPWFFQNTLDITRLEPYYSPMIPRR